MAQKVSSQKKFFGLVFLVVGILLVAWGFNEAGSLGGKLSKAISGSPGDRVLWFYISGAVCVLIGLFNLVRK